MVRRVLGRLKAFRASSTTFTGGGPSVYWYRFRPLGCDLRHHPGPLLERGRRRCVGSIDDLRLWAAGVWICSGGSRVSSTMFQVVGIQSIGLLLDFLGILLASVHVLPLKVSSWMLNRRRGVTDGKSPQEYAPCLESLREDLGPRRGRRQGGMSITGHGTLSTFRTCASRMWTADRG